jgi:hypothetical protein
MSQPKKPEIKRRINLLITGNPNDNGGILVRCFSRYKEIVGIDEANLVPGKWPQSFPNGLQYENYWVSSFINDVDLYHGIFLDISYMGNVVSRSFGIPNICHIVGSDAKMDRPEGSVQEYALRAAERNTDLFLYSSKELRDIIGIEGKVIAMPIEEDNWEPPGEVFPTLDVLYYCPNSETYRMDWILKYAEENKDENITVLIGSTDQIPTEPPENILWSPLVSYDALKYLYWDHKKLIRVTTHDGQKPPRMPCEALYAGLDVYFATDGKDTPKKLHKSKIPKRMLSKYTVPKYVKIYQSLIE